MRLLLIILVFYFISCSDSVENNKDLKGAMPIDDKKDLKQIVDFLSLDTPKMLKAGKDYNSRATSPNDRIFFGDKFSPYKMEPYDIAQIERIIDSIIQNQQAEKFFRNKTLSDFKYHFFSVKIARQKLQVRVNAFSKSQANGDCYFSFIFDLTDKKIISYQVESKK